jgi:hypothetical protein
LIDTGVYVIVARPEKQPNQHYTIQSGAGEGFSILKEDFLTLTLGRRPQKNWVFVACITNEVILGLDILCAYNAPLDLGCQILRIGEEEILLWSLGLPAW